MTKHLLAMELGPVLQIIAAARKTRDIWFGSWMLSEVSKAAARKAVEFCGSDLLNLVAPAAASFTDFDDPAFSVGDEIIILVPEGIPPADVAQAAKDAAHQQWLSFARDARRRVAFAIRNDLWDLQTLTGLPVETAGETVDLYAAWIPLEPDYRVSLLAVKRLLFGRTQCRNFPAAAESSAFSRDRLPKSSLDGRRETVLQPKSHGSRFRPLRLLGNEQLDALGVTKRVGQGKANYPSTARVAADPWIRGAATAFPERFAQLQQFSERLAQGTEDSEAILGRAEVREQAFPTYPQYRRFAYEGAILYETRHQEFLEEAGIDGDELLRDLRKHLRDLIREHGEPGAYYAVLIADGDNVAERLLQCQSPDDHRELSRRLSSFAGGVRNIVQRHQGALVFAAGEDITAFVPLDQAVDCADALRKRFEDVMNTGDSGQCVTLTVGIAIGHFMESLDELLAAGREMESWAKSYPGKNALAVQYRTRSGSAIQFRYGWDSDPAKAVKGWIGLLKSARLVAYDLKTLVDLYRNWPSSIPGLNAVDSRTLWANERDRAMRADVVRLLSSKQSTSAEAIQPLVGELAGPDGLENLANTIIIAGHIKQSLELAGGLRRTDPEDPDRQPEGRA